MGVCLFTNNAAATLGSAITSGQTTIPLTTGQGTLFPSPTGGDYFYATLVNVSNTIEIVKCTSRASDVLTVLRGQEGTAASAYSIADKCELRVTAAGLADKLSAPRLPPQIPNYLSGLTFLNSGSTATFGFSAGAAMDSTNTVAMVLAAAITKTGALWAVGTGNGALDTGVIAASSTYHFYLIQRLDTQVTDVIFSLSAGAPALPANYTVYRRIFALMTDGSATWTLVVHIGDDVFYQGNIVGPNSTISSTTPINLTLPVPTGIIAKVFGVMTSFAGSTSTQYACLSSIVTSVLAGTLSSAQVCWSPSLGTVGQGSFSVLCDTLGRVAYGTSGAALTNYQVAVSGFTWARGR